MLKQVGAKNKVIKYDGKKLPFKANTFDAVLSLEVIEHAPDPNLMLEQMENGTPPDMGSNMGTDAGDNPAGDMEQGDQTPEANENEKEETSLFLTPDMLPPGMKLKAGQILEFKVMNPGDKDGSIEVCYNDPNKPEGEQSWEDGFRKEMSARAPGNDIGASVPESASGGY